MKTAIIYLVIINIAAFCMYGMDKSAAIKHKQRIPNKVLIGMAFIGGSIGALAGMYTFRHKTQQKKYTITVPVILILQILAAMLLLSGCGSAVPEDDMTEEQENAVKITYDMQVKIGDTPVAVTWENNDAVDALAALTAGDWHEYQLSMYSDFEQVGPLGSDLPASDEQTTTQAGDIVLYQGNQIVVFYGSNSWAYTRLGHITDKSEGELAELLSNGDTTISLMTEYSE